MHQRYDLVIFDFDGTLADSVAWMFATFNSIAQQFGLRRVSEAELQMLRGRSNREIVRYLGVPAWKIPRIAMEMRERVAREREHIPLYTGVQAMFEALPAHVRVAIVTSNSELNVRAILGERNAARVSYFACGASIFGKAKKFKDVLARSGVSPQRTLCVGDETRDIEAARAIGAPSAAVTWGYATETVLQQFRPTYTVRSFEELVKLLAL